MLAAGLTDESSSRSPARQGEIHKVQRCQLSRPAERSVRRCGSAAAPSELRGNAGLRAMWHKLKRAATCTVALYVMKQPNNSNLTAAAVLERRANLLAYLRRRPESGSEVVVEDTSMTNGQG